MFSESWLKSFMAVVKCNLVREIQVFSPFYLATGI